MTITSFRIRNKVVSTLPHPRIKCTTVTHYVSYQMLYPDSDVSEFPVITFGSRYLDNMLLDFINEGSISYRDLLIMNINKIFRLFSDLDVELTQLSIVYPSSFSLAPPTSSSSTQSIKNNRF
jgi:hypothetical protein